MLVFFRGLWWFVLICTFSHQGLPLFGGENKHPISITPKTNMLKPKKHEVVSMFLLFFKDRYIFRFHVSFFWGVVHLRDRIDFKMGIQMLKVGVDTLGFLEHG